MPERASFNNFPLGLFELDAAGTVIYYKPERDNDASASNSEMIGCNFFDDITPIKEARDLQEAIKNFSRSHQPAHNFTYAVEDNHDGMQVKILLARIHEQSAQGSNESVFVHIKKA